MTNTENTKTPNPNTCETQGQKQIGLDADIYRTEAHLEQLKKLHEIREAARPLMSLLESSFDPMTSAIVDMSGVRIVQDLVSVKD